MLDEDVQGVQVPPANVRGTQTKVVLLAIALAEPFHVGTSPLAQAVAPDVHAKAHSCRNIDHLAWVRQGKRFIQLSNAPALRQCVGLTDVRVAADCCIVGERCDGAHSLVAVSGGPQPVEPIVRHLGVAIKQHHVVVVAQRDATIHGAAISQVFEVLEDERRASLAANSRNQSVRSGSGLASFTTTRRQGVRTAEDSTASMQRRVSSRLR